MSAPSGLTEIHLASGGWIVGLVVDLDDECFYLSSLKHFMGASKDVELHYGGITEVPHGVIVSMKTHPAEEVIAS